ncbi:MAG: cellulase family glycosylhydrolase [Phycisphaerales bacterium]
MSNHSTHNHSYLRSLRDSRRSANRRGVLFAIVTALLCGMSCAAPAPGNNPPPPPEVVPAQVIAPYRVLFMGDSITLHGIVLDKLHWDHVSGMAASSQDKDYVHLVVAGLTKAIGDRPVELKLLTPQTFAVGASQLQEVAAWRPDLVVVQLGEHENDPKAEAAMRTAYDKLVGGLQSLLNHPRVICTGAWAPDAGLPYGGWAKTVEDTMRETCQRHKVSFVSMQDIAHDPKYRGFGEHPGVRWHPNDAGMAMYAQRILEKWRDTETPANPVDRITRYRGFNIETLDPAKFEPVLEPAAQQWRANIVRHALNAVAFADHVQHKTYAQAFDTLLEQLPAQLDAAKKNDVVMVLVMPQRLPNEKSRDYPKGKEGLTAFWNDPSNLDVLIDCWTRIAKVCADRDQPIWFDLLNEPLDWKDFPSYPQRWPDWAQKVTDAIRKIDTRHPIMIETGPGGLCWGMKDFPMLRGGPFIYSIHVYVPHEYTHQGLADIQNTDLAKTYLERQKSWPGPFTDGDIGGYWDRATLERAIQPAIDFQKRHPDIRIFVGEFSAIRWAPNAQQYLQDCISIFEQHGWDWAYHSFRGYSGWNLEDDDQFSSPQDAQPAKQPTARAQVISKYLQRNVRTP